MYQNILALDHLAKEKYGVMKKLKHYVWEWNNMAMIGLPFIVITLISLLIDIQLD
jgi:hypothetical protein